MRKKDTCFGCGIKKSIQMFSEAGVCHQCAPHLFGHEGGGIPIFYWDIDKNYKPKEEPKGECTFCGGHMAPIEGSSQPPSCWDCGAI